MLSVSTGTSVAICCYHSVAVGWWSCTAQWRLVHCSEGGFAAVNLHADPVMSPAWAPACQVLLAHSRLVFLRALFQDTVAKALGGFPVSTKSILPHVTFLWWPELRLPHANNEIPITNIKWDRPVSLLRSLLILTTICSPLSSRWVYTERDIGRCLVRSHRIYYIFPRRNCCLPLHN